MWADLVVQLAPLLDKHLRILEDLVVHCRVGYRSSESGVLLLELLETLDLIELQTAERIVADELEGVEGDIFIATKVSPANLRFDDVVAHAEASRQRVRVKRIDLYQIHGPSSEIPIGESMRAMEELVTRGVIRYIGISNFSVDEMKSAQDALKSNPLVSNQVRYNLRDRAVESDVLPYCQKNGVTLIAHTPLAMGRILSPGGPQAIANIA